MRRLIGRMICKLRRRHKSVRTVIHTKHAVLYVDRCRICKERLGAGEHKGRYPKPDRLRQMIA